MVVLISIAETELAHQASWGISYGVELANSRVSNNCCASLIATYDALLFALVAKYTVHCDNIILASGQPIPLQPGMQTSQSLKL